MYPLDKLWYFFCPEEKVSYVIFIYINLTCEKKGQW